MERLDQIEPWRAATDRQLYYWVGVDSGRAISFAKKFRFRSTGSRQRHLMNRLHQRRKYRLIAGDNSLARSAGAAGSIGGRISGRE